MKHAVMALLVRRVTLVLLSLAIGFGVLHIVSQWYIAAHDPGDVTWGFLDLFNLGAEASLPTWYSQILLVLLAAAMAGLAYWFRQVKPEQRQHRWWAALSVIALAMSIDEGATVHEKFGPLMHEVFDSDMSGTLLYYPWVIIGAGLVLLVVVIFFRFWWRLPARTRWLLALAALVFVGGSIGIESLSGYYASTRGWGMGYQWLVLAEELCEMIGVIIAIYAVLDYMRDQNVKLLATLR